MRIFTALAENRIRETAAEFAAFSKGREGSLQPLESCVPNGTHRAAGNIHEENQFCQEYYAPRRLLGTLISNVACVRQLATHPHAPSRGPSGTLA